jgi:hypothetical protein
LKAESTIKAKLVADCCAARGTSRVSTRHCNNNDNNYINTAKTHAFLRASGAQSLTLVVWWQAEPEVFEYLIRALVDHAALEAHQRVASDGQSLRTQE